MKAKSSLAKTLLILTGICALLYCASFAIEFILGDSSFSNLKHNLRFVLLLIFLTGYALSFTRKRMGGIIILIWNAGVWIFYLLLNRNTDEGEMFMGLPVMVFGALFLLEWHKNSKATLPAAKQQWKYVLRVLLINYAVLYGIVVISELTSGNGINYFSLPNIIGPLLLLIFLVGFVLSWKKELFAGFIFLIWCVVLILAPTDEILKGGPWSVAIIPILIQGVLYIYLYYLQKQPDKKPVHDPWKEPIQ